MVSTRLAASEYPVLAGEFAVGLLDIGQGGV
jgi:hypothetical protein